MKRIYYIEQIKKSGLKNIFIAEKLNVHPTKLSRWLNGLNGSQLNNNDVLKLDILLEKYQ